MKIDGYDYVLEKKDVDKLNAALPSNVVFEVKYREGISSLEIGLKDYTGIRESSKIYVDPTYQKWIEDYILKEFDLYIGWDKSNTFWLTNKKY